MMISSLLTREYGGIDVKGLIWVLEKLPNEETLEAGRHEAGLPPPVTVPRW
jgi:hypothetical protein